VTDYVAHPNTILPRAHAVQSCQIGNFCRGFSHKKGSNGELHEVFRIILDFSHLPLTYTEVCIVVKAFFCFYLMATSRLNNYLRTHRKHSGAGRRPPTTAKNSARCHELRTLNQKTPAQLGSLSPVEQACGMPYGGSEVPALTSICWGPGSRYRQTYDVSIQNTRRSEAPDSSIDSKSGPRNRLLHPHHRRRILLQA
jgi:hypothetical protein